MDQDSLIRSSHYHDSLLVPNDTFAFADTNLSDKKQTMPPANRLRLNYTLLDEPRWYNDDLTVTRYPGSLVCCKKHEDDCYIKYSGCTFILNWHKFVFRVIILRVYFGRSRQLSNGKVPSMNSEAHQHQFRTNIDASAERTDQITLLRKNRLQPKLPPPVAPSSPRASASTPDELFRPSLFRPRHEKPSQSFEKINAAN